MLQESSLRETRPLARELKFLATAATVQKILPWARARLTPDPYASGECGDEYKTTSLYFDTANLDVYHRRGSFRSSKFRVRQYEGTPALFLERKLRTTSMVIKRRTMVPPEGLQRLAAECPDPEWIGYWFRRRLDVRKLSPTCQVSYRRVARVGMNEHGPIRLTCDREIRARSIDTLDFLPEAVTPVLNDHFIVEMKFRVEVPGMFKSLIEECALEPLSVSKYRLSLEALGRTAQGGDPGRPLPADQVDIIDA